MEDAATGVIAAIGTLAVVSLESADISGGTLKTASGGAIDVGAGGAVFDGSAPASPIANSGNVSVLDSSTLLLLGTIDNSGSVTLASTGDQTFMSIGDGGAALTGGGKIILTSNGEDGIESGGVGSPTLTNVNNTISGNGVLGDGLNVINEADGVIDANLHSFPTAFLSIADATSPTPASSRRRQVASLKLI